MADDAKTKSMKGKTAMKADQSYKIVSLIVENIKNIRAVEIKPDGNMVEITGRNGAGKTSILDSIWWALAGKGPIQGKPIRDGQEKATIELSLGPVTVTRTFTATKTGGYTTSLILEGVDGMKYDSPQSILNAIVGDLTFDPLAFTRESPKEQFAMLQKFVEGYDFDDAAMRRKNFYTERTDVNRQAKALETKIQGIPDLPEGEEILDLTALTASYQKAVADQREVDDKTRRIASAVQDIEDRTFKVAQLKKEIEKLEGEMTGLERIAKMTAPAPIDIASIEADMEKAQSQTELAADQRRKKEQSAELLEVQSRSAELTAKIETIDEERQKAIQESKIPVQNITFGFDEKDNGIVMLDGVPFEQGSDAQQLRAAIEIAIAMNPQLRVCRVRDGSLIDEDGMKALAEYAEKHDFQIWIERVDTSGKSGIVIEDGALLKPDA